MQSFSQQEAFYHPHFSITMVASPKRSHVVENQKEREAALSDKPLPVFGFSTAAHAINLHKALSFPVILAFMVGLRLFPSESPPFLSHD